MAFTPSLTYKGRPLVRCGNDIYYGSMLPVVIRNRVYPAILGASPGLVRRTIHSTTTAAAMVITETRLTRCRIIF